MSSYNFMLLFFLQVFVFNNPVSKNNQTAADLLDLKLANSRKENSEKTPAVAANIVFQSADGGQNWKDLSAGLPPGLQPERFFATDSDLYIGTLNGIYRSNKAASVPVWEKEKALDKRLASFFPSQAGLFAHSIEERIVSVFPSRAGLFANTSEGRFFQKINGTGIWSPVYTNFEDKSGETILEAQDGKVFIGTRNGMFKSADEGKTWKQVVDNGWVMKIVESAGVLLCTYEHGILRSTDGGDHWDVVISEGGVGIDVESIKGGFAAITYNTESKTRRIRISTDGGKTWTPIDAGLPPHDMISSIRQVGDYFYCGHPDGVYRSSDKGKTWKLLFPAIDKKVFELSVSGKVIYAMPKNGGC